ncbi:RNA polymerase sigma-70 factor [Pedobacter nyackensis]|uniref:RNA polymerase sigma-70 factor n=1 Tax=Pedobacter nyackensis TaxID=475255 RepID=UPI0029302D00|nr:RNA polymerase sigma-70 factor [Pedobacter nyackensis]
MQDFSNIQALLYDISRNSSEVAYKKLFVLLFPALKRFACCFVKSAHIAEEIAADVMITLWRNRDELTEIRNIMVYSFVIAKNLSMNFLKRESGKVIVSLDDLDIRLETDNSTPEQILISDELKNRLNQNIDALPPRCKLVFKLIRQDGMSYKEVAEVLGVSVKTVDAQLVIAVRRLAESVKKEFNLI